MSRAAASVAALCLAISSAVYAQRTDDNVTAQSEDAFGRSVGNESIGIYNPGEVRGFSPIDAGNVRIEGLYFDRQSDPTSRLVDGSFIRVGIAAQSYPFPSPTGIVDYDLRRVGERRLVSSVLTYGPFGGTGIEIDAQFPITSEKLGLAIGAGAHNDAFRWGGDNHSLTFAIIPRWNPTESIELRPFFSGIVFRDEEPEPLMVTADTGLPPKITRNRYYGQPWAQNEGATYNYGLLGRARIGQWTTRLGLFESIFAPEAEFAEIFTGVDDNANANEFVVAFPDSRFASRSGELRAERTFEEGDRRHTLHFTLRAREQQRRYGGEQVIDAGPTQLGVQHPIAQPTFVFGPQSHDDVSQQTFGAAYELRWKNRGEMSLGFQKTSYSKSIETPQGPLPESKADPLLPNITATLYATKSLAIYASYTEGLEESPVAPDNAVNRNVAAPALETEQYDAGIRWRLPANLTMIAGVFNVEKPYFDVDPAGFFKQLGTVQHRGVEFSLTGTPMTNLTVVGGTRVLDASVSGPTVDAGLIGSKPVHSAKTYWTVSADYRLAKTGFSFDATAEGISPEVANTANTVEIPGRTVVHLGGRYRFELLGKPATLRAQVSNVFDRYGWLAVSSGVYIYNAPRRFTVYLAADF